jgi:two-component system chemotaxis sensor kinase CheA
LQLVLDSTGDGLLSVTLDGIVQAERSRAASVWFGEANAATPETIWSLLHPDDQPAALAVRVAFEQLAQDWLPFELSADQMPKQLQCGDRTLELAWKAVHEDGVMKRVLVIGRDVTEQREAERAEREAKEIQDLVGSVLRDKAAFTAAVNDARDLLQAIASVEDSDTMRRALHTLKGNMAMFGFHGLAASCHELESALAEPADRPTQSQVATLRDQLEATLQRMKDVVGTDFLSLIEVCDRDVDRLMHALEAGFDRAAILKFVASWRDESVEAVLRRFAAQASRIATSLGKEVEVIMEDGGARVPSGELRAFWGGLVHAVRNAVDHGIETPDERVAAGKPRRGRLILRVSAEAHVLTVRVEDDGRGLDFDALRSAAQRKGLPTATREDLIEAMFMDGVTTKSEVTSLSGRGVGMAALRETCQALGGTIDVDSGAGTGTRLTCRVPLSRVSMVTLVSMPPTAKGALRGAAA